MNTANTTDRFAQALGLPLNSDEAGKELAAARGELAGIENAFAAAEARAVDPTIPAEEARAASDEAIRLTHERRRLASQVQALEVKLSGAKMEEQEAARRAEYEATLAERDATAAEVVKRYPKLAGDLVDLLKRIVATDQRVRAANAALPRGATGIADVEAEARRRAGYPDHRRDGISAVPGVTGSRIMDFSNRPDPIWPQAVTTTAPVVASGRLYRVTNTAEGPRFVHGVVDGQLKPVNLLPGETKVVEFRAAEAKNSSPDLTIVELTAAEALNPAVLEQAGHQPPHTLNGKPVAA